MLEVYWYQRYTWDVEQPFADSEKNSLSKHAQHHQCENEPERRHYKRGLEVSLVEERPRNNSDDQ